MRGIIISLKFLDFLRVWAYFFKLQKKNLFNQGVYFEKGKNDEIH